MICVGTGTYGRYRENGETFNFHTTEVVVEKKGDKWRRSYLREDNISRGKMGERAEC